jgi:hypothetical protein
MFEAGTREIWKDNWQNFCEKYQEEYPTTITYIRDNVIATKKQKIVAYWRNTYLNWGIKASSAAESLHNAVKSELGNSLGDLKNVVKNMRNLLRRHYHEIRAGIVFDSMQYTRQYGNELLSHVVRKFSMHALAKVLKQITLLAPVPGQGPVGLPPCTGLFRKGLGLPCAHEIKHRKDAGQVLSIEDFHPHWLYDQDLHGNPAPPHDIRIGSKSDCGE